MYKTKIVIKQNRPIGRRTPVLIASLHDKEVLTAQETADFFGFELLTIRNHTSAGKIPVYKREGRRVYYSKSAVSQWLLTRPGQQRLKRAKVVTLNQVSNRAIALQAKREVVLS